MICFFNKRVNSSFRIFIQERLNLVTTMKVLLTSQRQVFTRELTQTKDSKVAKKFNRHVVVVKYLAYFEQKISIKQFDQI